MRKPVSLLALDESSATLAHAVQQRIATSCGLEDLVQWRRLTSDAELEPAIQSIHAQRQRPDSPLRLSDDISRRELVLLVVSAAGPARSSVLATTGRIRQLYEMKRLASVFTIELLCLLPEVIPGSKADDYGTAYEMLKDLSAAEPNPFGEIWLLDAVNGQRVRFGALDVALDAYADAVAGVLTFEPEMSGALPGIHPRGMPPVFSSFGYAELVFPRERALERLESRFAAELVREKLLAAGAPAHSALAAKQFVAGDPFAVPLSRIGVDAGQSLFRRFQPRTHMTEETRSAEEVIAGVRSELAAHRANTHLQNLETLARQGDRTAEELSAQISCVVDGTLDRDGFAAAIGFAEALLDPLPDLRDGQVAPRNLVTEINAATAALDARLGFLPNTAGSTAARKRVRELDSLLQDHRLVADTLVSLTAAGQIEELEREKASLTRELPEILFAEESENNAARLAARDTEAARLTAETNAREEELRELFAQLPRAEQALREALEERRGWIWRQIVQAAGGVAALYGVAFALDLLMPHFRTITQTAIAALVVFASVALFRYATVVAPRVRQARESLERLRTRIDVVDKAKNAAHNDELQFEYDVAHRRTALQVLRRTREVAKLALDALRMRAQELEELANSFVPSAIAASGLTIPIVDDVDVDRWYTRTAEDRKPFLRELPIRRSEARHMPLHELRESLTRYAATAFESFRTLTLADAATHVASETTLAQRLKRFAESSAPLIELRDDDLQAEQVLQRDTTLWIDPADAVWAAQIRRRFPESQPKPAPDPIRVHVVRRVLHFPGYVLGQIDYYRAHAVAAGDAPDLVPPELSLSPSVRAAYEQVLLGRATGVVRLRDDGQLASSDAVLGATHLAAAERIGSADGATLRERLADGLAPRLSIAAEVERDLRQLAESVPLTSLERGIVGSLLKRYGM